MNDVRVITADTTAAEILKDTAVFDREAPNPFQGTRVLIRGNEDKAKHAKGLTGYVLDVNRETNMARVSYGDHNTLGSFHLSNLLSLLVFHLLIYSVWY